MTNTTTREYEVWVEGFSAMEQKGQAGVFGRITTGSFKEACILLARDMPEAERYFNQERLTWWGCRLFDNEADARKAFG
jgi:hypothetical protein